jgi:tetratricopeptide (TPR) repeat protein
MKKEIILSCRVLISIFFIWIGPVFVRSGIGGTVDDQFKSLLALGKKSISLKNYSSAIKAYQDAIKLNGNNDKVFVYLGYAYYRNSQPVQAIENFKKALDLNPQSSLAHYNLALTYWVQDRPKNGFLAENELVQALGIDPLLIGTVEGDPKFRDILKYQELMNFIQFQNELNKFGNLKDETNFTPLKIIAFKEDLVKLISDFTKANIILPNSWSGVSYDDSDDEENIDLIKRFQGLGLDKENVSGLTYYSFINHTPLIFWLVYDKWFLIDSRNPTEAILLNEGVPNQIQFVVGKETRKDTYYIDIEMYPGSGWGRVTASWLIDLKTKLLKLVNCYAVGRHMKKRSTLGP